MPHDHGFKVQATTKYTVCIIYRSMFVSDARNKLRVI